MWLTEQSQLFYLYPSINFSLISLMNILLRGAALLTLSFFCLNVEESRRVTNCKNLFNVKNYIFANCNFIISFWIALSH